MENTITVGDLIKVDTMALPLGTEVKVLVIDLMCQEGKPYLVGVGSTDVQLWVSKSEVI